MMVFSMKNLNDFLYDLLSDSFSMKNLNDFLYDFLSDS